MKPLLLTPGDPAGVGPEVAVRALAARIAAGRRGEWLLVGDAAAIEREARRVGLPVARVSTVWEASAEGPVALVDPGDRAEPVEVASVRLAVAEALAGRAAGVVTGPIHKARLAARGFPHPGHTEFLGALCGVAEPVMAFVGGRLKVALVTTHLPLRDVADAVTEDRVLRVLRVAAGAMHADLGIEHPVLHVCGLNPHAGDRGRLGKEDGAAIAPAVERARREGIDARGPASAEAVFRATLGDPSSLAVAMYHDQGLAPLKVVDFGRSVNWTLGLPIVRTSVDHGTADDIAGKGVADPSSFDAALAFAERLATVRRSKG